MKNLILVLYFISSFASAEKLEDVKLLNVVPSSDKFQLKLQTKDGPKDSYFYVEIMKNDAAAFEKLAHVFRKTTLQNKYNLTLDIMSFSPSPSGSYYRADGIKFSGAVVDKTELPPKPQGNGANK